MIFIWDGNRFERVSGKWICRDWAMRGPRGTMLNKEVPEPYASQIEKAYHNKLSVVNEENDIDEPLRKQGVNPLTSEKKLIKKIKKVIKDKKIKKRTIKSGFRLGDLK